MPRYIDAEFVEKEIASHIAEYEKRIPEWSPNDMLTSGRDAAVKYGFKADGAATDHFYKDCDQPDVQPVKIAKWLEHNGYIYCSNCETEIPTQDRMGEIKMEDVHYCRFCGAKMERGCEL